MALTSQVKEVMLPLRVFDNVRNIDTFDNLQPFCIRHYPIPMAFMFKQYYNFAASSGPNPVAGLFLAISLKPEPEHTVIPSDAGGTLFTS